MTRGTRWSRPRRSVEVGHADGAGKAGPPASPPRAPFDVPKHVIDLAVQVSGLSPCRSKRGVVIFSDGNVISHGYNYKPRGFECDGSEACKASCRREAIHAEQQALLSAGSQAHASELVHVKTVDGHLVPSGGPSCVECSKLARAVGIAWVWLYHADGWRRYEMADFHRRSLAAESALNAALDAPSRQVCATCVHLTPFELAPELNTCPVVNIRIHTESAAVFGCNQWEARPEQGQR
jgi:deoxycytidylate deaminase